MPEKQSRSASSSDVSQTQTTTTSGPSKGSLNQAADATTHRILQGAGSSGKKHIVVSITDQTLTAYEGDKVIYQWACTTGGDGHNTEPGLFHVLKKDEKHYSQTYHAEMDYALFFSPDGKAIHESHLVRTESVMRATLGLTWFGSHGCVRLPPENAATLFQWAQVGTEIRILP